MTKLRKNRSEKQQDGTAARSIPISHLGGSDSDAWNHMLGNQVLAAIGPGTMSAEDAQRNHLAAYEALQNIRPRDEIEGMLVAQMIAAHSGAMECYARAMVDRQTIISRRENLSAANKLSRAFTSLLESLNRHRGKGQQKVTVEHVHVHSGAQAVVGVVETRGVGVQKKSEEQPHAQQVCDASEPPMWSTDAPEDPVPVSRNEERPLSDARRKGKRRTDR